MVIAIVTVKIVTIIIAVINIGATAKNFKGFITQLVITAIISLNVC